MHRAIFALYIYESDDGSLSVLADYAGEGRAALPLGMELMAKLASLSTRVESIRCGDVQILPPIQ